MYCIKICLYSSWEISELVFYCVFIHSIRRYSIKRYLVAALLVMRNDGSNSICGLLRRKEECPKRMNVVFLCMNSRNTVVASYIRKFFCFVFLPRFFFLPSTFFPRNTVHGEKIPKSSFSILFCAFAADSTTCSVRFFSILRNVFFLLLPSLHPLFKYSQTSYIGHCGECIKKLQNFVYIKSKKNWCKRKLHSTSMFGKSSPSRTSLRITRLDCTFFPVCSSA